MFAFGISCFAISCLHGLLFAISCCLVCVDATRCRPYYRCISVNVTFYTVAAATDCATLPPATVRLDRDAVRQCCMEPTTSNVAGFATMWGSVGGLGPSQVTSFETQKPGLGGRPRSKPSHLLRNPPAALWCMLLGTIPSLMRKNPSDFVQ